MWTFMTPKSSTKIDNNAPNNFTKKSVDLEDLSWVKEIDVIVSNFTKKCGFFGSPRDWRKFAKPRWNWQNISWNQHNESGDWKAQHVEKLSFNNVKICYMEDSSKQKFQQCMQSLREIDFLIISQNSKIVIFREINLTNCWAQCHSAGKIKLSKSC